MPEIDLSTLMLIGLNDNLTRIITIDDEFIFKESCKKLLDNSCRFFGNSLTERVNMTSRLINSSSKAPIIIEESRKIIFFPLKSTREKNNIWISFNNLDKYEKNDKETILYFKCGKIISLNFSYYIIDNQITRSLLLNYELEKRRKSLEK